MHKTVRFTVLSLGLAASLACGTKNNPSNVQVSVSPTSATVGLGQQQSFTANVTGSSNTTVLWSVQESAGGIITSKGVYTAPKVGGTYHVVATSLADATKTATATVNVPSTLTLSPATTSLNVSTAAQPSTQQFTVMGVTDTFTWSVKETNGGSITAGGLYTAPATAGAYHVVATSTSNPQETGTATVNVGHFAEILPANVTVAAGTQMQFFAPVFGDSTQPTVSWSVTESGGGSIATHGLYTAPSTAGTYHVVAHLSGGLPDQTATVTVSTTDVTGYQVFHHVGEGGVVVDEPGDLSEYFVQIYPANDLGVSNPISASINGFTFDAPNVPAGNYLAYVYGPRGGNIYLSATRSWDLSYYLQGRPNLVSPGASTAFNVNVNGIGAGWSYVDDLQLTAWGAGIGYGSFASTSGDGFLAPSIGATSYSGTIADTFGDGLIDTTQGDKVTLHHIATQALARDPNTGQYTYVLGADVAMNLSTLTMQTGQTSNINGTLGAISEVHAVNQALQRTQFHGMLPSINPGARELNPAWGYPASYSLYVDGVVADGGYGRVGGTPDVYIVSETYGTTGATRGVGGTTTDVSLAGSSFGNPFSGLPTWNLYGSVNYPISVEYAFNWANPDGGAPLVSHYDIRDNVSYQDLWANMSANGIKPYLNVPGSAQLGGVTFSANQTSGGGSTLSVTPTLTWTAPTPAPQAYVINVYYFAASQLTPPYAYFSQGPLLTVTLQGTAGANSFTLPANVLAPAGSGLSYVFSITAVDGVPDITKPFAQSILAGTAPTYSGIYTP